MTLDSIIRDTLVTGLPLVPLTMGIYLVFRMREDFDLTVDGSFTAGGVVGAALLVNGTNVPIAMLIAILAGGAAGMITALQHSLLRIPVLLAGLVTSIGLFSVNLHILGIPSVGLTQAATLFSGLDGLDRVAHDWAIIAILGGIVAAALLAVALFLKTEIGLALRVSGRSPRLARSQGAGDRQYVMLALVLANGLCALSGVLVVQDQSFADVNMGVGSLLAGVGAFLLGELIARPTGSAILRVVVAVLIGTVLYRLILTTALAAGLPATDVKLATALTLVAAVVLQRVLEAVGARRRARRRSATTLGLNARISNTIASNPHARDA